jgi:hypothetical protein
LISPFSVCTVLPLISINWIFAPAFIFSARCNSTINYPLLGFGYNLGVELFAAIAELTVEEKLLPDVLKLIVDERLVHLPLHLALTCQL